MAQHILLHNNEVERRSAPPASDESTLSANPGIKASAKLPAMHSLQRAVRGQQPAS
jgi:hypothetical protein